MAADCWVATAVVDCSKRAMIRLRAVAGIKRETEGPRLRYDAMNAILRDAAFRDKHTCWNARNTRMSVRGERCGGC